MVELSTIYPQRLKQRLISYSSVTCKKANKITSNLNLALTYNAKKQYKILVSSWLLSSNLRSPLIHRIAGQQQQRITALFKPSKKQYFTLLFGDA
jgi:hypothetical protein